MTYDAVSAMHGIRAISFDADDTLWDFGQVMRRSLGFVLEVLQARHPVAAAGVTVDTLVDIRDAVERKWAGTGRFLKEIRTESFRQILTALGVPDEAFALELDAVYFHHRYGDIQLYADVLPALGALDGRYMLGILSNGNSYPERVGLDGVFQFTVFAEAHGVEKPDARLFHVACAEAGHAPHAVLHVGDSLEKDVAGAQAAGLPAVWLNRDGAANATDIRPDAEIRSLAQLPALLESAGAFPP